MAQYQVLNVTEREVTGSQKIKTLRRAEKIPAILYFHGQDNINLTIDKKTLWQVLHTGQHIFEVNLNKTQQFVMIKEIQYHPVTDEIIHIDLMRVRRSEKITISVPLVLEGEAIGIKEGGVLMQSLTSIEIKCLPTDVPEHISVDVSALEINNSYSVSDIAVPEELEIATSGDITVVGIQPPRVEVEPVAEEVEEVEEIEEAAEEGEEAPEEETPEKS